MLSRGIAAAHVADKESDNVNKTSGAIGTIGTIDDGMLAEVNGGIDWGYVHGTGTQYGAAAMAAGTVAGSTVGAIGGAAAGGLNAIPGALAGGGLGMVAGASLGYAAGAARGIYDSWGKQHLDLPPFRFE